MMATELPIFSLSLCGGFKGSGFSKGTMTYKDSEHAVKMLFIEEIPFLSPSVKNCKSDYYLFPSGTVLSLIQE